MQYTTYIQVPLMSLKPHATQGKEWIHLRASDKITQSHKSMHMLHHNNYAVSATWSTLLRLMLRCRLRWLEDNALKGWCTTPFKLWSCVQHAWCTRLRGKTNKLMHTQDHVHYTCTALWHASCRCSHTMASDEYFVNMKHTWTLRHPTVPWHVGNHAMIFVGLWV